MIEALRQERPSGQAVQFGSHLLQNRLGGWVAGPVAHLLGIFAQVKQLLVNVLFLADIRPLAILDGSQRRTLLGQTPVITLARIVGNDLRQRRERMTILPAARRATCPSRSAIAIHQEKVSRKPSRSPSTIVAARSARLTGSLTVFLDALLPGGMMRSGT